MTVLMEVSWETSVNITHIMNRANISETLENFFFFLIPSTTKSTLDYPHLKAALVGLAASLKQVVTEIHGSNQKWNELATLPVQVSVGAFNSSSRNGGTETVHFYLEHKLLHGTLWDMATRKEIRPDVVAKISKAQLEEIKEPRPGNRLWPSYWETGCFMTGNLCVMSHVIRISWISSENAQRVFRYPGVPIDFGTFMLIHLAETFIQNVLRLSWAHKG